MFCKVKGNVVWFYHGEGPSSVIFSRSSQLFPFDERGGGCLDFSTNYHVINKALWSSWRSCNVFFQSINRLYVRLTNPIKGFKIKFSCWGISMKWYLYYVPIQYCHHVFIFLMEKNIFLIILRRFNHFFQVSTKI